MKKGVGALEIIFGMFILIIVVLVLIRMFTAIVTPKKIQEQLVNFESAYQITAEQASCSQLCDNYQDSGCSRRAAASYCLKKINIDISGDKRPGEPYRGNYVNNIPYCEDGLYCFHINDCSCGNYKLTPERCIRILCDYYKLDENIPSETAIKLITNDKNGITWGTCNKNPKTWTDLNYEPPDVGLTADYWWDNAGYDSTSCENIQTGKSQTGGVKLDCTAGGNTITCNWSGCPTGETTILSISARKEGSDPNQPGKTCTNTNGIAVVASGNCKTFPLDTGNYVVTLNCGDLDFPESIIRTTQNIVIN